VTVTAVLRGVVALDGPSGTGKTTVARRLAQRLGAGYLDTGAMYRAVTVAALRSGADLSDGEALATVAAKADVVVGTDPCSPSVKLGEEDVSAEIRGEQVTASVSAVAAVPAVRERLVTLQRELIAAGLESAGGMVVEGRDIGTVVVPDAGLKVFLTADPDVRAARRAAQDSAAGRPAEQASVRAAVDRRDRLDSTRAVNPMRPAEDAVHLDTSELDIEQVVTALLELLSQRDLLDTTGAPQ
jgi:cytidylate kinase